MTLRFAALISFVLGFSVASFGQTRYQAVQDPASPAEIPFKRYLTRDKLDRQISFYLSIESTEDDQRLPLIVFILGSGAHSNFIQRGGRILDAHRILREETHGRARVLAVEKPGVAFLSQPSKNGTAIGATPEFLREHTATRWTEAVNAAISAARKLPEVDVSRLLVVGHSEGSRIAARVVATNQAVTHYAGLAGFATSRLRCFMIDRDGRRKEREQIEKVISQWRRMLEAPDSTELFSGHTYRYWASFSSATTLEHLLSGHASIYLSQGTRDARCAVDGFELLQAQLFEQGRRPMVRLIEGADHGFALQGQPDRDGWREEMMAVVNWFLAPQPESPSSTPVQ